MVELFYEKPVSFDFNFSLEDVHTAERLEELLRDDNVVLCLGLSGVLRAVFRYKKYLENRITWISQRPFTMVEVCFADEQGHGFSKVMHPDEWDILVGKKICFDRACRDLARQIFQRAQEHSDWYNDWFPASQSEDIC